ncbi:MAG TPA: arsinothricin resistance N-acetyltransferase ArsN1 family B [Polyangiaceae bacterium]|nr:arsinothricin resistance N-acetyltransferase ArsN1 family B [Polyangiaceae bacterium]
MKQIRIADAADAPGVAEVYAPMVARTAISFETEPPTSDEMARRIAVTLAFGPWLVCVDDGRVDGYAYASPHRDRAAYRWSVDVSVYVRDGQRRSGIGRALYGSLLGLLRAQGFYAAHAGITLPNAASVGLHEGLGFRPVGVYSRVGFKGGAWHDVGWWQLELRRRTAPPEPVATMGALQGTSAWAAALAVGGDLISERTSGRPY